MTAPADQTPDRSVSSTSPSAAEGHRPFRAPTAFVTVALVLVLAGLVAVASQGTPVWMLLREGRPNRAEILADVAGLWGLGIVAAAAVTVFVHGTIIARQPGAPPLRTTLLRALPITTVALAALSLLAIARTDLGGGAETADAAARATSSSDRRGELLGILDRRNTPVTEGEGSAEADDPVGIPLDPGLPFPPLVMVVGVVAAALAGATAWRWYRARSAHALRSLDDHGEPAEPRRDAVQGTVADTIDAMLADPDPNTAVIGAYARLLDGLAACGAGRRDHEAPMEHLHRVLTVLRVRPEPLRRLTELFEIARFSTRPLDAADRERALDALRAVSEDLDAAAPSPSDPAESAAPPHRAGTGPDRARQTRSAPLAARRACCARPGAEP